MIDLAQNLLDDQGTQHIARILQDNEVTLFVHASYLSCVPLDIDIKQIIPRVESHW